MWVDTTNTEGYNVPIMATSLKEWTVLRGYEWLRRWHRNQVVGFPDVLTHTDRLLICLPDDPEAAREAVGIIPSLIECLGAHNTTVACNLSCREACAGLAERVRVEPIDAVDKRWSGLPRKGFVAKIKGDGLNAAIDLSQTMQLFTASLCLMSGADLRVGFRGDHRNTFFNVQVAVSSRDADEASTQESDSTYLKFLNTIRGMMGQAVA